MSLFRLDLVSGGQAELVLEEPDPFPSSYFISLEWNSGIRVWQILTKILAASKRSVCAFSLDLHQRGLKQQDVTNSAMRKLLQTDGYAFGIFWDIDPVLAGLDQTENKKFMMVRDPRDLIVSSYLAMRDAGGSAPADLLRGARRDAGDSNSDPILDYVRSTYVDLTVRRYRRCAAFCRSAKNVTVFRYEDVMFSWRQFISDLVEKLELDVSLESAFAIADSYVVFPKGSPVGGQDPRGLHRTFPDRFGKIAMAVLEEEFADAMAYFGYVPEGSVPRAFLDRADEFIRAVSERLATAGAECFDLAAQIRNATERVAAARFKNLVIPLTILSTDGGISRTTSNIKFCYAGYNPYATIKPGEELRIFDGSPAGMVEITDAYTVPGSICLYDRHGVRIMESCIRRGRGLAEFAYAGADTISLPTDFITINEPLVYLSLLENYWGHFLTEGISRLWAFVEYPELAKMGGFYFSTSPLHRNITDFIRSINPNIRVAEHDLHRSIRFRNVLIPRASFSNRGEAFSVHRKPASAVIDLYLRENGSQRSDQPVFLSRSRISGRREVQNQDELEKALARNGFLIVYPEELSLAEQIILFNQYRHFSGLWGSAFHTAILSRLPSSMSTHVMCHCIPNENYLMFDSILGNDANYVRSMSPVPGKEQVWPYLNLAVDVEQVLNYHKGMF